MKIPTSVSSRLASIKAMGAKEIAAKAAGIIAIGATAYDAHHWAKLKAYEKKNNANANAGLEYFQNTQYLSNRSHLTSKIKRGIFHFEIGQKIRGGWNATKGYIGGFLSEASSKIIPIAASVGALALKGKHSLISAGVLAGYTLISGLLNSYSHVNHKV